MVSEKGREEKIGLLISKIKEKGGIGKIEKRDLLRPEGYAAQIAKEAKLTRVQLRKIFAEFKWIKERYDKDKGRTKDEILMRIYKLYPLIQYQKNRNLINEPFKNLLFTILDNLEEKLDENLENAYDFIEALVAYTSKES